MCVPALLCVLGQVPAKIYPSWTRDKSSPRDKAHRESVKQVQVLHFFSPYILQILIKSLFVSWWQNWVSESPSVRPRPLRNKPSVYSSHTLSFNCQLSSHQKTATKYRHISIVCCYFNLTLMIYRIQLMFAMLCRFVFMLKLDQNIFLSYLT